jgi:hypothetical protein
MVVTMASGAGTAYPCGAPEFALVFFNCHYLGFVLFNVVFAFLVQCYDFHIKKMFVASLLPFEGGSCCFVFYLFTYTGVQLVSMSDDDRVVEQ